MPSGKKRKHSTTESGKSESSGADPNHCEPTNFSIGHVVSEIKEKEVPKRQTTEDQMPKKRKKVGDEKTKYPTLSYVPGKLHKPLKVADLQTLLLYCFCDGVAPQWVALKNSGHIRKVVTLMVPGLEPGMFDGRIRLDSEKPPDSAPAESDIPNSERWKKGLPLQPSPNPTALNKEDMPRQLQPLADIFPQIWPVTAPGDSKYLKLHSPLQAMLLCPLPKSKDKSKKSSKSYIEDNLASQRTQITTFLSSRESLLENGYVLHPALFTDPEKAANYRQCRVKAGQSIDDGWVDTHIVTYEQGNVPEQEFEQGSITAGREVFSVDCEMIITQGGESELARISLISWDGEIVLDELVKPERPVIDYLTRYSGITPEILAPVTTTLKDIQSRLLDILHPRTILVGHSLESDLTALKLTHPFIIDTSIIFPHPRGTPLKSSLKWLTQKYLGKEIQKGDNGHDSIEDSKAALELVKKKCEKGESWGTSAASNESVFARLSRSTKTLHGSGRSERTGAVVDWGNPERGLGAHATVTLGCENDEEIVASVNRAIHGDPDGKVVPGGGVDFTWARLRGLEAVRGWANRMPDPFKNHASTAIERPEADVEALDQAVTKIVQDIKRIYDSLPSCTIFMVYTGTGDPREVVRLQGMHRLYMAEFKGRKPWDELTIKWTDVEEQALRAAFQKAREGCGFMVVK